MGKDSNPTYVNLDYIESRLKDTEYRLTQTLSEIKKDLKEDLSEIKIQTTLTNGRVGRLEQFNQQCPINGVGKEVEEVKKEVVEVKQTIAILTFLKENPKFSQFMFVLFVVLLGINGIKTVLELFLKL